MLRHGSCLLQAGVGGGRVQARLRSTEDLPNEQAGKKGSRDRIEGMQVAVEKEKLWLSFEPATAVGIGRACCDKHVSLSRDSQSAL